MITIDWTLDIGRTPDDVFRHLVDIERYPEWQQATGITSASREGDDPLASGSTFRMERLTRGNPGALECTVTAFEPGQRFAFRGEDSAGFSVESDTRLSAHGPGTRLDYRFSMTTPGLLAFAGSMLSREVRSAAERDFANLKRRLEQVA